MDVDGVDPALSPLGVCLAVPCYVGKSAVTRGFLRQMPNGLPCALQNRLLSAILAWRFTEFTLSLLNTARRINFWRGLNNSHLIFNILHHLTVTRPGVMVFGPKLYFMCA